MNEKIKYMNKMNCGKEHKKKLLQDQEEVCFFKAGGYGPLK